MDLDLVNSRKSLLGVVRIQENHDAVVAHDRRVIIAHRAIQPALGITGKVEVFQRDLDVAVIVLV